MSAWEYQKLELASTSAPDDPSPVYDVDLTPYVDGPVNVQRGRGGQFDSIQNATLACALNNADHRFTPGNTASPLSPNWRQGRRVRLRETIGNRSFDLFSGCLELPEISDWASSGIDQVIQITAIDRMGCLDRGRTFLSNLGEYILDAGGALLQAFYPLLETGGTAFRDALGVQPPFVAQRADSSMAGSATAEPTFSPAGGAAAPGDDAAGVLFAPSLVTTTDLARAMARGWGLVGDFAQLNATSKPPLIELHAGDKLTIVCWVAFDLAVDDAQSLFSFWLTDVATGTSFTNVNLTRNSLSTLGTNPGQLQATVFGGMSGTVASGFTYATGSLVPLAVQMSFNPNTLLVWAGSNEYVAAAPTGTPADPQQLWAPCSVGKIAGTATYLQIYVGAFTRQMFLDQLDAGWTGLVYQSTGERVATVARYAGVQAPELVLDGGVGRMPKARLAGRRPGDALRDAPGCEQGRLFTAGNGSLVFHDRLRTTYL